MSLLIQEAAWREAGPWRRRARFEGEDDATKLPEK
jgi:hypothetical protein